MDRYEEALSRARKLYNEAKANEYTSDMEDYEFIFPELKESDDERIRKRLLALIEWSKSYTASGITTDEAKDMIDWLEKQGEQKSVDKIEPKFKVGDIITPKDRGHEPWQIMQVDILDKKYRFKDGYVIHFSQEANYELVEQNACAEEMIKLQEEASANGEAANTVNNQAAWRMCNWILSELKRYKNR